MRACVRACVRVKIQNFFFYMELSIGFSLHEASRNCVDKWISRKGCQVSCFGKEIAFFSAFSFVMSPASCFSLK